jgi:hypothetical protein
VGSPPVRHWDRRNNEGHGAASADFFAELSIYCDLFALKFVGKKVSEPRPRGGGAELGTVNEATPRKSLDDPSLHAPRPEHVLDALDKWRRDHMGYDDYVQALAAIKGSLGPRREEFKAEVLKWSPGVHSSLLGCARQASLERATRAVSLMKLSKRTAFVYVAAPCWPKCWTRC